MIRPAARIAALLVCCATGLAGGCSRCGAGDGSSPPKALSGSFRCTLVIGYSQVEQWYEAGGAFESTVEDGEWQLLAEGGAGVDRWQDPGFAGWRIAPRSPCASEASAPDRALLSISGPYGADELRWAEATLKTLAAIRRAYPSVRQVVLQPVVGGPGHRDCFVDGQRVRASWQHAHIDAAIATLVEGSAVVAGISPEVRSCADYRDALGHLTPEGAAAAGRSIGAWYARR